MNTQDVSLQLLQSMVEDGIDFSQARAYTGDVLFTEKMSGTQVYIIKEGQVDLYLMREERRVVVESLTKGQCFGMNSSLLNNGRAANAMASTYTEFYMVDGTSLEAYLAATPKPIRAMLTTLAGRVATMSELVATRVNYQPEMLVYAQLLQIVGFAELGGRKADARSAGDKQVMASVLLADFFAQVRIILGHSDLHFRHTLGKLLRQHLIRVEDESGNGKRIVFSPKDIVMLSKKLTSNDKDKAKMDYEYVTIGEFADIVEVDRNTLLTKLARSEFSEDIFTFRKSEVVRLLDTKGKKFFSDRKIKTPAEFIDIEDVEFADQKSIVEVLAPIDTYDIAKLLSTMEAGKAKEKLLNCLPRAKRQEVDSDLSSMANVDAIEAAQIGQRIIAKVKEIMLNRA
jgi:CRP-like cAMP-binding protein